MVFVGGVAALAHQFFWTRRLIDLLGASNESSTRVFGCFFLGLSVGAAFAALRAEKIRNPWRAAAWAECGVAVLCLPVIFLPAWTDWLWPVLGTDGLMGWSGTLAKTLIAFVAIFPPACCMGFSFPVIIQGGLASGGKSRSGSLILYGLNTLGGAAGLLLVLSWLYESLGLVPAMLVAGLGNVLIGFCCFFLARREPHTVEKKIVTHSSTCVPRRALLLAFASGAMTLALEVLGVQMLLLVAPATLITPGAILFAVILVLAIPPLLLPLLLRFVKNPEPESLLLRFLIPIAALSIVLAPVLFMSLARSGNFLGPQTSLAGFAGDLVLLALLSLGPAWLLLGTLFPLTIAWSMREGFSESQTASALPAPARTLGILLAINGLGGFIGAELALHLFMPLTGIYGSIALLGGLLALCGGLLPDSVMRRTIIGAGTLAVVGLIAFFVVRPLPTLNPYLKLHLLDEKTGPEGSVAVVEDPAGERSILVSNQYTLGGTAVRFDQERQALLPLLLHPDPKQVACIGVATGITPGAVLQLKGVERLTAIELSPLVVRAADQYFTESNYGVTRSDRARIVIEDGRTYIASAPGEFDLVCGDLFLPWAPGETRLYSHEHFTSVHASLRDGGVFCQWLAMYQLTEEQFQTIADTFAKVFPNCQLFLNHFRGDAPMLGLIGWKDPADSHRWREVAMRRIESLRVTGEILDPILRHFDALELLALGRWEHGASQNTAFVSLNDPTLEFGAARERLTGNPGRKYYFMNRWFKFCLQLRQKNQLETKVAQRSTALQSLESATAAQHAMSGKILDFLKGDLPKNLLQDQAADWTRWPGSVVPK